MLMLMLTLTLSTLAAPPVVAQGAAASAPMPAARNAPAGASVGPGAAAAGGASVATCVGCHGQKGEGNAAAGFPRLAGQSSQYLSKQLADYASGRRSHPVMTPIAKALTPEQMGTTAGYYAALEAPWVKPAAAPADNVQRGERLAAVGDERLGVQACANCHGPGGQGEWPAYPYLKGQHAQYLAAALANWKNGSRNNDPSGQMPSIARKLGDADVAAVNAYLAQLPPTSTARQGQNVPAGSGARLVTTPPPRPGGASVPATGTGVEQGSPTQGGTQGPGGAGSGSGPSGAPATPPSGK